MVLHLFEDKAGREGITRAQLARRSGKRPEQVTRMLGSPGNWTLETLTGLLLAMGCIPTFGYQRLDQLQQSNYCHPLAVDLVAPTPPAYSNAMLTNLSGVSLQEPGPLSGGGLGMVLENRHEQSNS